MRNSRNGGRRRVSTEPARRKSGIRIVLGAAVLVLAAGALWAGGTVGPRLVVHEERYDFGRVQEGTEAVHVFEVRNGGDQTLEIQRISSS